MVCLEGFSIVELIPDGWLPVDLERLLVREHRLVEPEHLDQGEPFSPEGLRKTRVDFNALVAVAYTLPVILEVVMADGPIRVEAVIAGVDGDGLRIGLDGFVILFAFECFVPDFLPLLGSLGHLNFLIHLKLY